MSAGSKNESPLIASGLSVKFGGLLALNELSIEVRRGEVLGLIGPNGSGKTTFFNVISGIYAASAGQVLLDGRDITTLRPHQIAAHGLARTFQRSRLCLSLSVFDNLMLGAVRRLNSGLWYNLVRRDRLAADVRSAAKEARDLLAIFNPDLAGKLWQPAISLGMIDRRRLEICRALIGRPKIVLLDEPSAGMTHDETNQLMNEILEVRRNLGNLTVVMVEHEMGLIERATDRCVVLNYGKKICEGKYADVAADPLVREAYLGKS
ncbi:MAG: ABC transporter ATP-binding protein [Proteobacteria bacterium]|nr:ABC transporter ATP-binding protein [Pseudomonadota bacterium]